MSRAASRLTCCRPWLRVRRRPPRPRSHPRPPPPPPLMPGAPSVIVPVHVSTHGVREPLCVRNASTISSFVSGKACWPCEYQGEARVQAHDQSQSRVGPPRPSEPVTLFIVDFDQRPSVSPASDHVAADGHLLHDPRRAPSMTWMRVLPCFCVGTVPDMPFPADSSAVATVLLVDDASLGRWQRIQSGCRRSRSIAMLPRQMRHQCAV